MSAMRARTSKPCIHHSFFCKPMHANPLHALIMQALRLHSMLGQPFNDRHLSVANAQRYRRPSYSPVAREQPLVVEVDADACCDNAMMRCGRSWAAPPLAAGRRVTVAAGAMSADVRRVGTTELRDHFCCPGARNSADDLWIETSTRVLDHRVNMTSRSMCMRCWELRLKARRDLASCGVAQRTIPAPISETIMGNIVLSTFGRCPRPVPLLPGTVSDVGAGNIPS